MTIRTERPGDIDAIRAVHQAAFGTNAEADLVDRLRTGASPLISLVAEDESHSIVGHILFSPVTLPGHPEVKIAGLGPVAVVPDRQRAGIGSSLVRSGLDACVKADLSAVVLVGHPTYYPRFGFQPASRFALTCEYDVPDDVFMALELRPCALTGMSGTIHYHSAFRDLPTD